MANSPLLNVMKKAVEKAGRAMTRDFGEIENIQGNKEKVEKFIFHTKENAEKVLLMELDNAREGFGYISSLNKRDSKSGEKWLINIISGEENFTRGIPHWSISLALEEKGEVIAGVVYDVVRNDMFYAQKGFGAFANDRRLKVKDVKEFDEIIAFSSFNAKSCGAPMTRINQGIALYNKCVKTIRSIGDTALDIVYIAAGKGELQYSNCCHDYEVAAAAVVAKEAGAFVSDLKGNKNFLETNNIVVATPSLHGKAIKVLNV